jgi:predicted metal-dependent HD superfamily phosphohydrolase|nr:hypothetical protein [Neorhizobium tomejilense]
MTLITNTIVAELRRLHADRPYHNWTHVEAMLRLLRQYREFVSTYSLLEAAIFFHDVICTSYRQDNEERSANLALEMLGRSISGPMGDILKTLILSTRKHVIPDGVSAELAGDIGFLLDFDLSILGAPADEYEHYVRGVRQEYDWATESEWKKGRGDFLRGILARPAIFHTKPMFERFEEQARRNVSTELSLLDR